ncbi:TetR/AcrR family transcriptional regulator [Paraburkholderia antibiotica]|uniref:TetR/AcrR family transcriptional regulator n=1 Tax=Paraburkholderia antibiotica TaxID=2728839 RepID=A0A7X9ZZW8_9BURK|nr:TetR/AcrR family transcriptional regulator [Paraburkholderia antibiotica]NML33927.1 TetR/AcrR family transcriptional regulator [Paraburkholderia antibiotica]
MGIAERKNRQKQALRERILDAARRIVMREGFAALSMRKIADAIEYSPATLYLHFESRDEIARALCEEGFAQLLERLVPLAQIADPAERLQAFGRAYVAFGVEHPQTYRLIFMEDPSYTGAALGRPAGAAADGRGQGAAAAEAGRGAGGSDAGGAGVQAQTEAAAGTEAVIEASIEAGAPTGIPAQTSPDDPTGTADKPAAETGDDPGAAALRLMIDALDELRAAGRLSASIAALEPAIWAEALWASLHGIVALNLTCPIFPGAPLDTIVGVTLDAWLGVLQSVQPAQPTEPAQLTGAAIPPRPSGKAAPRARKSAASASNEPSAQPVAKSTDEPADPHPKRPTRRKAASA